MRERPPCLLRIFFNDCQNMFPANKNTSPSLSPASAVIICWIICVLTAFICELGTMALIIVQRFAAPSPLLGVLATLLILAAVLSGLFGLVLLPFVLRRGREIVPRQVILVSTFICGLPLLFVIGLIVASNVG